MKRSQTLRWLRSHRVAVLKGGWSAERPISLKTGDAVEQAFKRLKIPFQSIDVKKDISAVLAKKKIQFCFICLHGPFGEDGQLQHLLDAMEIGYTGSGAIASSLAMKKNIAKIFFKEQGVPSPEGLCLSANGSKINKADEIALTRLLKKGPVFVKPNDQGSAIGIARVNHKRDLNKALSDASKLSDQVLVERFIPGRELTVGVLGSKALPAIEIVPEHEFYDFHSKYAPGGSRHLAPAPISKKTAKQAAQLSLRAFKSLGCDVYGRVDFIFSPAGKLSVLEVNTIPGMTKTSLLPEAANVVGISFDELVLDIVGFSLEKN